MISKFIDREKETSLLRRRVGERKRAVNYSLRKAKNRQDKAFNPLQNVTIQQAFVGFLYP